MYKSQIKIIFILCVGILINILFGIKVNAYVYKVDTTSMLDIKEYLTNKDESQYKITDSEGMNKFSSLVNSGINFAGKSIYLANDIDFDISIENNFTAIGNYDYKAFEGTFDGQGHVLRGININKPNEVYQAVFSYTKAPTIIKNLGVIDSTISGSTAVGGICAMNMEGVIDNCYCNSTLICNQILGGIVGNNTGRIINCINYSNISGNPRLLGGICGRNSGTISVCCNLGKLVAGSNIGDIGGICAENSFDINNCYNTGSIIGNINSNTAGICGSTYVDLIPSNINNTFNVGTVTGGKYAGGIVGINRYFYSSTDISNNYYLIGSASSGIGRDDSGSVQVPGETSDNMKTDTFKETLNASNLARSRGAGVWIRDDSINDGYPAFESEDTIMYKLDIINDSTGGSISYNGITDERVYVESGTKVNLEVKPNDDYLLSNLIINDVPTNNTTGEFIMPSKDSKVSPIFEEASDAPIPGTTENEIVSPDNNENLLPDVAEPEPDINDGANEDEILEDNDIDKDLEDNTDNNTDSDEKDTIINRVYNSVFNTGDNRNVNALISIITISLVSIACMIIFGKKKKV